MKTTISAFLLALSATTNANAFGAPPIPLTEGWVTAYSDANREITVNLASLHHSPNGLRLLQLGGVFKHVAGHEPGSYALFAEVFNCVNKTYGMFGWQEFTRGGTPLGPMDTTPPVMQPIAPGTAPETLWAYACKPQE